MYELQSFGLALFALGVVVAFATNLRPVALVLGFIPHARRGIFRLGLFGALAGGVLFVGPLLIGLAVNAILVPFS
ncbi:hypothetical protein ACFSBZ_16990 [Amnibacterium flavum]|uniref:hypothetical protein n=1 Tax=Amnibacterium flavum TaxID=2173173 RepID=UPI0014024D48|nr:hypothetical protein [Amnibacterium flavum]